MGASQGECEKLAAILSKAFAGKIVSFETMEADVGFMVWVISQESIDDLGPMHLMPYLPSSGWRMKAKAAESRGNTFYIYKDLE